MSKYVAFSFDHGGNRRLSHSSTNSDDLIISGKLTLSKAATDTELVVTGNTTIGGTLGVTGNTTVGGTMTLNDNVSVTGSKTLTVGTGATTLGGTLGVTGNTTVDGNIRATQLQITSSKYFEEDTVNRGTVFLNDGRTNQWKGINVDSEAAFMWYNNTNGTREGGIYSTRCGDWLIHCNNTSTSATDVSLRCNDVTRLQTTTSGVNITGNANVSNDYYHRGVKCIHSAGTDIYANIRVIRNESTAQQNGMYINYHSTGGTAAHCRFYANAGNQRMTIRADNGNVGIGTDNPGAKLQVAGTLTINNNSQFSFGGSGKIWNNWNTYFRYGGGNLKFCLNNNTEKVTFSSWAVHCNDFVANVYHTNSDSRIKKNIIDVDDSYALTKIRLLEPKRYNYCDQTNHTNRQVIGFIAQEVKAVLPEAAYITTDKIPNIYELASVTNSNIINFTSFDTANLDSNSTILSLLDKKTNDRITVNITNVLSSSSVEVDTNLDTYCYDTDNSGSFISGTKIFVYGQKVTDFHVIRKDAIWTVATAALQEVDRQLQAEKAKVATLETTVAQLLARVTALEGN